MSDKDHWADAHTAAVDHFNECMMELHDEIDESPACAPFCGCDVCIVREVLHAAYPYLEKHFAGESTTKEQHDN
jgi:hypothetical protein